MEQVKAIYAKIQKFIKYREDLPIHGGGRSNNGIKGMPMVDKWVALSVFWLLLCVVSMIYGVYHCRANAYSYSLKCLNSDCTYLVNDKVLDRHESISFPKLDLIDAEMIRVDSKGEFADAGRMRSQKNEYYGHTIRLKIRLPPEPNSRMKIEKNIIFNPHDMTRRLARMGVKRISDSISKQLPDLWYEKSAMVTTIGMLCIFFGIIGLILTCFFGQWTEYNPRRLKKAS